MNQCYNNKYGVLSILSCGISFHEVMVLPLPILSIFYNDKIYVAYHMHISLMSRKIKFLIKSNDDPVPCIKQAHHLDLFPYQSLLYYGSCVPLIRRSQIKSQINNKVVSPH